MTDLEIRKGIKTLMSMAQPQLDYVAAKAKFDLDKSLIGNAFYNLTTAEESLIVWAKNRIEQEMPNRAQEVAIIWNRQWMPGIRKQLIDTCMRLR